MKKLMVLSFVFMAVGAFATTPVHVEKSPSGAFSMAAVRTNLNNVIDLALTNELDIAANTADIAAVSNLTANYNTVSNAAISAYAVRVDEFRANGAPLAKGVDGDDLFLDFGSIVKQIVFDGVSYSPSIVSGIVSITNVLSESEADAKYATAAQGDLADTAVQDLDASDDITSIDDYEVLINGNTVTISPLDVLTLSSDTYISFASTPVYAPADPVSGTGVGDRDFNDKRYGPMLTPADSIADAITAASAGDIIRLSEGVFTENIALTKAGISLIGVGSGVWDESAGEPVGGTIIKGNFTTSNTATNLSVYSLGFQYPGSGDNVAMFGGATGAQLLDLNITMRDVKFYGDGSNMHNCEFRGGGYDVRDAASFNAGTHPFAIKTHDSFFGGIAVDGGSSGIILKSQVNMGTCSNTVLDGFSIKNVAVNTTPRLLIENDAAGGTDLLNAIVRNGVIEADGCVGVLFSSAITNSALEDVELSNVTVKDPSYGISVQNKAADISVVHTKNILIKDCIVESPANYGVLNHPTAGYGGTGIVVDGLVVLDGIYSSGKISSPAISGVGDFTWTQVGTNLVLSYTAP